MEIFVQKLEKDALVPFRATSGAAGADLYSYETLEICPGDIVKVRTAIAMEIPFGYFGMVVPRSGIASKHGIAPVNSPGTIDSDYRGEIFVVLTNHSHEPYTIKKNDRIAQLIIVPYSDCLYVEGYGLSTTKRGKGGYGSTGR